MSDQEKETLRLMRKQSEAYKESRPTSPAQPSGEPPSSADGWVSVKERLPEPYTTHLFSVISLKGPSVEMGWRCDDPIWQSVKTHSWDMPIYFDAEQVTHWRPLPTPPVDPSPEKGNE